MTKIEFMEKLSAGLKARQSDETADSLLADFNEHFEEALRAGQCEEEICEMLGDPEEIAAECSEHIEAKRSGQTGENENAIDDPGIFIRLFDMGLYCEGWDGNDFHVEVRQNNKVIQDDAIKVRQSANSLQIVQEREWNFIHHLFHVFRLPKVVRVKIPRRFCGNMSVKVTSGSARIDGVSIEGDMRCEVSSGSIKMLQTRASGALTLSARSGSIKTESCIGNLSAECHSGSVKITSHKGNVLKAAATSGSVRIDADRITKDCSLSAKSGSIRIDIDALEANLNLDCYSGSIKFSIGELKGNITGKTRSGSIVGMLNRDTRAVFLLQSADVSNKFPNAVMPDADIPIISLSSRSGHVNIKEL